MVGLNRIIHTGHTAVNPKQAIAYGHQGGGGGEGLASRSRPTHPHQRNCPEGKNEIY